MLFNGHDRVVYAKNPLVEVICQVRFPPVLQIDAKLPAGFQERVRGSFPQFEEEVVQLQSDLPDELLQAARASLQGTLRRAWRFKTSDQHMTVGLTRDFLALSTDSYKRWELFRVHLDKLITDLMEEYNPAYFTRVGLRYRNVLTLSELNLKGTPWASLLAPHIAAEFSSPELTPLILESAHRVLIDLPDNQGKVNLRHGTSNVPDGDEDRYVIDNDFFSEEQTEAKNVLARLDFFNKMARNFFRECITEELHLAMEPVPVAVT